MCDWYAERSHHGIADELLDGSTFCFDLFAHRTRVGLHHLAEPLGIELLAEGCRTRDVGKQDRDDLPLFPARSVLRRTPAGRTEASIDRDRSSADGAADRERAAARGAEPGSGGVLRAAVGTGHHGGGV